MRLLTPCVACLLVGCTLVFQYERAPEGSDATCRGGVDEDLDGLADCDDPDCELSCIPRPIPPELPELACPPGWREDGADDVLGVRVPRCEAPAQTCPVIEPGTAVAIVIPTRSPAATVLRNDRSPPSRMRSRASSGHSST